VLVDGKPLGKSDSLFLVPPGVRRITIELHGYQREDRQIEIRAGWITRVEVNLSKPNGPVKPPTSKLAEESAVEERPSGDTASKAAAALLTEAQLREPVREAMHTVLRQHPSESRWSGRKGSTMFAIALKPLPQGEIRKRAVPALLELTHELAVRELLTAKSLLDRYITGGLTDATTLRQAVMEASGKLQVVGKVRGVIHHAAISGEFAVAYVAAEEESLTACLLQPAEVEQVRIAYRDVMHRQARDLMKRSNWRDALLLWEHLHQRKLVSQQLYLDAARCLMELNQAGDALRVLTEAVDAFGQQATAEFLEEAGDMALALASPPAESLAEKAYRMASERLRETVTNSQPQITISH
jgi:hypothetical protein